MLVRFRFLRIKRHYIIIIFSGVPAIAFSTFVIYFVGKRKFSHINNNNRIENIFSSVICYFCIYAFYVLAAGARFPFLTYKTSNISFASQKEIYFFCLFYFHWVETQSNGSHNKGKPTCGVLLQVRQTTIRFSIASVCHTAAPSERSKSLHIKKCCAKVSSRTHSAHAANTHTQTNSRNGNLDQLICARLGWHTFFLFHFADWIWFHWSGMRKTIFITEFWKVCAFIVSEAVCHAYEI